MSISLSVSAPTYRSLLFLYFFQHIKLFSCLCEALGFVQQSGISTLDNSSTVNSLDVIIYPNEMLCLGGMCYLVLLSLETGISLNRIKHLRFCSHDSHIQETFIILLNVPLSDPLHPISMNVLDLTGEHSIQKHIATEKFKRYISVMLAK